MAAGDWFCSERCQQIYVELRQHVEVGPVNIDEDYQWQLLHGKNGRHATTWTLKACHDILQESFDPIIDQVSGEDLLCGMVYSEKQGEWDHTGMFAAILRHKVWPKAPCLPHTLQLLCIRAFSPSPLLNHNGFACNSSECSTYTLSIPPSLLNA